MKKMKEYYKQLKDKKEMCNTFLNLDKDMTLLSSVNTISKPLSLSEIFKELDKIAKGEEQPKTPIQVKSFSESKPSTKIPVKKKIN